jgi:predicted heme/steroid binding protein
MNIPDRIITELELRHNTGECGSCKFTDHKGIVYDLTDCPKWRNDLHENLYFPGQNLACEIEKAPHKKDVFTHPCVIIMG